MKILEKPIENLYGVCPNCGTKILCSEFETLPKDKRKKEKRHIRCPYCNDIISSLKKVKVLPEYNLFKTKEKFKYTYKLNKTEYVITKYSNLFGYIVSIKNEQNKTLCTAKDFNQLQIYFAELQLKQSDK